MSFHNASDFWNNKAEKPIAFRIFPGTGFKKPLQYFGLCRIRQRPQFGADGGGLTRL
jgi:hypothetical protein